MPKTTSARSQRPGKAEGSTFAVAVLQEVFVTVGHVAQLLELLPFAGAQGLHDVGAIDHVGVHQFAHLTIVLPCVGQVQRLPLPVQLRVSPEKLSVKLHNIADPACVVL